MNSSELDEVLPPDLPERERLVSLGAQHLAEVTAANEQFNLTRIAGAREGAIKHVLDSVLAWRLFAGAVHVLDAGTGAGFPGIPLAIILPETRFTLAESIQKKARFVASVVESLGLVNIQVEPRRAEELIARERFDLITARAVAPLERALKLFGPALRAGTRLLLYKGPDAADEIAAAAPDLKRLRARASVILTYELPVAPTGQTMGSRTIIEVTSASI